jgi:hypothetical protein
MYTFTNYDDVRVFVAGKLGIDTWEGAYEYYPFSKGDPTKGFLEIIYPEADSSGRLLRGAAGNGPIFIFLYFSGRWTYLGEMYGAKVETDTTTDTTEFVVYAHVSATQGVERRYQFRTSEYVCVSEVDVGMGNDHQ